MSVHECTCGVCYLDESKQLYCERTHNVTELEDALKQLGAAQKELRGWRSLNASTKPREFVAVIEQRVQAAYGAGYATGYGDGCKVAEGYLLTTEGKNHVLEQATDYMAAVGFDMVADIFEEIA